MPYCIWITTHPRYQDVQEKRPDRLTPADLDSAVRLLGNARPLEQVRNPDGSAWLFRKQEEAPGHAPWLRMHLSEAGSLELSVSYTSPYFLANMYEAVVAAAWIAEHLSLSAFEEVHGLPVTAESTEKLMDPQGEYCQHEGRFALHLKQAIQEKLHMPFELPSGAVDQSTNLAQFRLRLPRAARVAQVLGEPPPGLAVDAKENRGLLYLPEADMPLVWVSRTSRGPGEFLIWHHWRQDAFLKMWRDAAMVAQHAHARLGGELLWLEEPWTEQRQRMLTEWPDLLGVELYEMVTQGQDPRPREAVEP